jgi:hypothetical protein
MAEETVMVTDYTFTYLGGIDLKVTLPETEVFTSPDPTRLCAVLRDGRQVTIYRTSLLYCIRAHREESPRGPSALPDEVLKMMETDHADV